LRRDDREAIRRRTSANYTMHGAERLPLKVNTRLRHC